MGTKHPHEAQPKSPKCLSLSENPKFVNVNRTPNETPKDMIFTISFIVVTTGWIWVKYERAEDQKDLLQLGCGQK